MQRLGLHRVVACLLAVLLPLTAAGVDSVLHWLATGPLHVPGAQISALLGQAAETLRADTTTWSAGALDVRE